MIFCENCGKQLNDGVKFCGGCGASIGGNATPTCANCSKELEADQKFCDRCGTTVGGVSVPAQKPAQPAPIAVNTTTIMAKNFRCSSCGNSLEIPKNARGQVKCPYCKNECLLDGIVKNAEIAAKQNIESGIPLSASPTKLHGIIVSVLSKSPNMPLDIFEKVEVIREEHYCVPAYCFHCNGTESFNYEVGNKRAQTYTVDRGDSTEVYEKTRLEWAPSSGTASVRQTIFASGNKKLIKQLQSLYADLNPKKLVDIEELIFPADVDTLNADFPQTAAFNEFAVPLIEKALKKKAEEAISEQTTTGLTLGGSNIQKDTVRIFLGIYRIVFKYDDKEYSVWVNGDGSRWYWNEGLPEDVNRQNEYEQLQKALAEKEQALESIPLNTGWLTFGMWACIIGVIIFLMGGIAVISVISLAGAILFWYLRSEKKKEYNALKEQTANNLGILQTKKDIGVFEAQLPTVIHQFKEQKKTLRGIYEKVSGDASVF